MNYGLSLFARLHIVNATYFLPLFSNILYQCPVLMKDCENALPFVLAVFMCALTANISPRFPPLRISVICLSYLAANN